MIRIQKIRVHRQIFWGERIIRILGQGFESFFPPSLSSNHATTLNLSRNLATYQEITQPHGI